MAERASAVFNESSPTQRYSGAAPPAAVFSMPPMPPTSQTSTPKNNLRDPSALPLVPRTREGSGGPAVNGDASGVSGGSLAGVPQSWHDIY